MPVAVDVKQMLEAGVHFGHQTRKWNPKMRPFIYTERDGIHIIDLAQTASQTERAYKFIADTVALGNSVLFVGTKKQACDVVLNEAQRVKQHYVTHRWLGGMLTNFKTIKASIDRLETLCSRRDKGELEKLPKKEALQIERQIAKLDSSLGGIRTMNKIPGVVFIVDPNEERIARLEANKLKVPVVALADTNADPDGIDYLIVGNDDAIRSIEYFTKIIADACAEGAQRREAALREQAAKVEKEKAEVRPAVREKKIGAKGRAYVGRESRDEKPVSESEVAEFAKAKVETKETEEKKK
jgi:small subunit ribosomal protein S2